MDGSLQFLALASQVAMGLALAACAGLRAFLPLFVVGVAGRLDWIPLVSTFEWLESTPALLVFGIAVGAELVADKVPWFDHVLDVFQSFVKPVAGVLVAAAVLDELTPLQGAVLAIVLGAGVAAGVHFGKSSLRVISTATTGGLANPVISVAEEGGAWALAFAAVLMPLLALTILLVMLLGGLWFWRRFRFRSGAPAIGGLHG